jgi:trk system potassium uptake protein TrkA
MKVIVIGGGKVGAYIANLLLSSNCSVKVIENRSRVLAAKKGDSRRDYCLWKRNRS